MRKGRPLGEKAGMVWKTNGKGRMVLRFSSDRVRFFDLFGKELRVKRVERGCVVDVSGAPVFFAGDECRGLEVSMGTVPADD